MGGPPGLARRLFLRARGSCDLEIENEAVAARMRP